MLCVKCLLCILQCDKLKLLKKKPKTTKTDQWALIATENLCFNYSGFLTPFQVMPAWCHPLQSTPARPLHPRSSSGPCHALPDVSHIQQVVVPVDRDRQLSTAQRGYVSSLSKGRRASCSLYRRSESRIWCWKRKAALQEMLVTGLGSEIKMYSSHRRLDFFLFF